MIKNDNFYLDQDSESRNFNLLKTDNELFNEEDNKPSLLISVRRAKSKNGEDWQILENNKIVLVLKSARFNNLEKEYLRGVEGMIFLISEYKKGKKSVSKIREEMKRILL